MVHAGRSPTDLVCEFKLSAQAIRNWVTQAERDKGTRNSKDEVLTLAEREE
ncbi:MAG: hypothetical protein WAP03_18195 [Methylorubrum rhodinum]